GTDPTSSDAAVPSGTELLVGPYTLKAKAFKSGCVDSLLTSATLSLTEPLGGGALAAGGSHSGLATPQGLLYAWGQNTHGQLGDGTPPSRSLPTLVQTLPGVVAISAGDTHTLAVTEDGEVYAWGSNGAGQLGDGTTTGRSRPVLIATPANVVSVTAGAS